MAVRTGMWTEVRGSSGFFYDMVWYDVIYLLTAVRFHLVAVVQYTFTHKQYIEQHNEFVNCNWVETWWQ